MAKLGVLETGRRAVARLRHRADAVPEEAPRRELVWPTLAASELAEHPTLVADLLARRLDGVTITGVITPAELAAALPVLEDTVDMRTPFGSGSLLGMPLGEVGTENRDRTAYYDDTERARAVYCRAFGFDPHERIAEVIRPATTFGEIAAPTEDGRHYNPGQVRWYDPGGGGLRAHAGNEFREMLEDGAMSHLVQSTRVTHHLSYFVVLQKPTIGGSLSVYDLVWEDHSSYDVPWGNSDRDDSWFDEQPATTIDPQPGGMVLFGGGWRWHRVEPVEGPRARMTYGGFCAPSTDGRDLHFWT